MPICPNCGTAAPDNARFCERDGTPLTDDLPEPPPIKGRATPAVVPPAAVAPGCRCGAGPEAESDGYCAVCGRKWAAPRVVLPRDHVERALSLGFAGVTDRGQRHSKNEDDFALSLVGDGQIVLVVCDGVSSSEDADRASAIAAKTLSEQLTERAAGDDDLRGAVSRANDAVSALYSLAGAGSAPPETTVVAAVVRERTARIAWVGDSRAYWIDGADAEQSRLLTRDHSWLNDVVESGEMTLAEAEKNRLAHAITRCLGASSDAESSEPTLATFDFPDRSGFLLLCSDGLWNYAPAPTQIAALIHAVPQTEGAVAIARTLVAWANGQGGRDNITVALLAVPAATDPMTVEEKN